MSTVLDLNNDTGTDSFAAEDLSEPTSQEIPHSQSSGEQVLSVDLPGSSERKWSANNSLAEVVSELGQWIAPLAAIETKEISKDRRRWSKDVTGKMYLEGDWHREGQIQATVDLPVSHGAFKLRQKKEQIEIRLSTGNVRDGGITGYAEVSVSSSNEASTKSNMSFRPITDIDAYRKDKAITIWKNATSYVKGAVVGAFLVAHDNDPHAVSMVLGTDRPEGLNLRLGRNQGSVSQADLTYVRHMTVGVLPVGGEIESTGGKLFMRIQEDTLESDTTGGSINVMRLTANRTALPRSSIVLNATLDPSRNEISLWTPGKRSPQSFPVAGFDSPDEAVSFLKGIAGGFMAAWTSKPGEEEGFWNTQLHG